MMSVSPHRRAKSMPNTPMRILGCVMVLFMCIIQLSVPVHARVPTFNAQRHRTGGVSTLAMSTMSTDDVVYVDLQPGVTYPDEIAVGTTKYYRVAVAEEPTQALSVFMSPLATSDPEIFGSVSNPIPGTQPEDKHSSMYGGDGLYFSVDELKNVNPEARFVYLAAGCSIGPCPIHLIASFSEPIQVQNGIPQSGSVYPGSVSHFYFDATGLKPDEDVVIDLTLLQHYATIYVSKADEGFPDPDNEDSFIDSSPWYAPRSIRIDPGTAPINRIAMTVKFAAVGDLVTEPARFSLTVGTSFTPRTLISGIPRHGWVSRATPVEYSFNYNIETEETCRVAIALTPASGNPDLMVTDPAGEVKTSTEDWRVDFVSFPNAVKGTYTVKVTSAPGDEADGQSTYSILATLHCPGATGYAILLDGIPQAGVVDEDAMDYYQFVLPSDAQREVSVTLDELGDGVGDPDILIRAANDANDTEPPTPDTAQWKSSMPGSDHFTIKAGEVPVGATLLIAVKGWSRTAYRLTLHTQSVHSQLTDGLSVTSSIPTRTWAYYVYTWERADAEVQDLQILLTSGSAGDPDVYVSHTPFPTKETKEWYSDAIGDDVVTIPAAQNKCTRYPCQFYIGVFAHSATSFTILATQSRPISLVPGRSQADELQREQSRYYFVDVSNRHHELTFTVTHSSGRTKLHVAYNRPATEDDTSYFPSSNIATVTVPYDQTKCPPGEPCKIYLTAVATTQYATFSVLPSMNAVHMRLANSVAQEHVLVADDWMYFVFDGRNFVDGNAKVDLLFVATALTGDPDIYISKTQQRPNANNTDPSERATSKGADALELLSVDPAVYYIGVHAASGLNTRLSFIVTQSVTGAAGMIRLIDGQPQDYVLGTNVYQVFEIITGDVEHADLTVSVTQISGKVDLYISGNPDLDPIDDPDAYKAVGEETKVILINSPDKLQYRIGVKATTKPAFFQLTARTDSELQQLRNGIPITGKMGRFEMSYYYIIRDKVDEDITITLTSLGGDPDLYISNTIAKPTPDGEKYTWESAMLGTDIVTIVSSDAKQSPACLEKDPEVLSRNPCVYYIGVRGYQDSEFQLSASFSRPIALSDGRASIGAATGGDLRHFTYMLPAPTEALESIVIGVTATKGLAWLYVSTDGVLDHTSPWLFNGFVQGGQVIIRKSENQDNPQFCAGSLPNAPCVYHIGVYAYTAEVEFSVTASTNHAVLQLRPGNTQVESVPAGAYRDFFYTNDRANAEVMIAATPLSGDPDLYGSRTQSRPRKDTPDADKAVQWGADVLHIKDLAVGAYHVSVLAAGSQPSTFSITAFPVDTSNNNDGTNPTFTQLADGLLQTGATKDKGWVYYRFRSTDAAAYVSFDVARLAGDPDLFVRKGTEVPKNEANGYDCKSASSGAYDVCGFELTGAETFTIGVYGYHPSVYTVLANTNLVPARLANGQSRRVSVSKAAETLFAVTVDSTENDLEISATVDVGVPAIHVSSEHRKPTAETDDTLHNSGRDNYYVYVPTAQLQLKTYYINVACPGACSFSISASFNARHTLLDGVPVEMTIPKNAHRYFLLNSPSWEETKDTTIRLASTRGTDVSMYAAFYTDPDNQEPSTYERSATTNTQVEVVIPYTGQPISNVYPLRILIVAGDEPVTFTLQAQSERAIVSLRSGIAYRDSASKDKPAHFMYENVHAQASIEVRVLPLFSSGDGIPSITGNIGELPGAAPIWRSTYSQPSVSLYATPVNSDGKWKLGNFYFTVTSEVEMSYSIVLIVTPLGEEDAQSILLIPGTTLSDALSAGKQRYYRIFSGSATGMVISIERTFGDVKMFANSNNQLPDPTDPAKAEKKADTFSGLTIAFENKPAQTWYDLLVTAEVDSLFSVSARSPGVSVMNLVHGLPVTNTLPAKEYAQYVVDVPDSSVPLRVLVTHISGDPDVYISPNHPNPTEASCREWCTKDENDCCITGAGLYGEDVTIPKPKKRYYIGVHAYTATTYRITAITATAQLLPGIPQYGVAFTNQQTLYLFSSNDPNKGTIRFTLTQNSDTHPAVMYISTKEGIPTAEDNMWSSTVPIPDSGGLRGDVVLHKDTPNACFNCVYRISVVGSSQTPDINYSLMVTAGNEHVTLPANTPHRGVVGQGQTLYFRAHSNRDTNDIAVDAFSTSSPVKAYVSRAVYPDKDPDVIASGSHILIPGKEGDNYGLFFIAVKLVNENDIATAFTLTFSTSNTVLFLGETQQTRVRPDSGSFFVFRMPTADAGTHNQIRLNLAPGVNDQNVLALSEDMAMSTNSVGTFNKQSVSRLLATAERNELVREATQDSMTLGGFATLAAGNFPTVYITTDSEHSQPGPTTPEDKLVLKKQLTSWAPIAIPASAQHACTGCNYFVGMYVAEEQILAINVETAGTITILQEAVEHSGSVAPEQYRYFALNSAHQSKQNITVVIEPCIGQVAAYASDVILSPTREHAHYQAVGSGVVLLQIPERSEEEASAALTAYTIGILGRQMPKDAQGDLEFNIMATTETYSRPLVPNSQLVLKSGSKPYSFEVAFNQAEAPKDRPNAVLKYTAYVAKSTQSKQGSFETRCGWARITEKTEYKLTTPQSPQEKLKFEYVAGVEETYSVNVIVTDDLGRSATYFTASMTTSAGGNGGNGGGSNKSVKSILVIVIPIGVALLLLVVYLFLKNRLLTKELEVEMQDVPKSAVRKAMRGPTYEVPNVNQNKNYSQLLAEDEEDSSVASAAYAPPDRQDPYASAVL